MKKETLIKKVRASLLNARLNQPFKIATGAHNSLENVLLEIELADGTRGFGEAAPASHITGETQKGTLANLQGTAKMLEGLSACDYLEISRACATGLSDNRCAATAVEAALLDALSKHLKMPMYKFFGPKPRILATDMTIVLGTAEEAEICGRAIAKRGIKSFKIKLNGDISLDFARTLAVAESAPRNPVRLDANQAYPPAKMMELVRELKRAKVRLELIEQPVPKDDWEGLREVSRKCGVCVCADEAITGMEDIVCLIKGGYAQAANIKTAKFGFILGAEMARLCVSNGIKLMIGGMMESLLAMTASAHMAAGVGGFDFVDLDTPFFVKDNIMRGNVLSKNGVYDLSKVKAGLGVTPCAKR